MTSPILIKREEVIFEGVRSYFFPSLLLHVVANEDNFLENGKLNPFASFILGLTNQKPSISEIVEMIVSHEDVDRLHTAIDALFVLGKEYLPQIKTIGSELIAKGGTHDVYELLDSSADWNGFEKNLAGFVRKCVIRKQEAKYLSYILKISSAKNENDKFNEIIELCIENLEWDAYVLIKLLGLETEERREEIEAIRNNILDSLKTTRPQLTDLIMTGPKNDIMYLLNHKFSDALNEINNIVVEKITPLVSKNDEISLENRHQFVGQLFYIILRSSLSQNFETVNNYVLNLPENIRCLLFNGFDSIVFEATFHLTKYFSKVLLSDHVNSEVPFTDVISSGLYSHLKSYWKRESILRILTNFQASITQNVFGSPISLFDDVDSLSKVNEVLTFLIWTVRSFDKEDQEHHILNGFLAETKSKLMEAFKSLQRFSEVSNEHVYRVISALEKSNNDISILTRGLSPETINLESSASEEESGVDTRDVECDSPVDPLEQTIIAVPRENSQSKDEKVSETIEEEGGFKGDVSSGLNKELSTSTMSLDGWEEFNSPSKVGNLTSNADTSSPSPVTDSTATISNSPSSRPDSRIVNDTFLLEKERPKPMASLQASGFDSAPKCSNFGKAPPGGFPKSSGFGQGQGNGFGGGNRGQNGGGFGAGGNRGFQGGSQRGRSGF